MTSAPNYLAPTWFQLFGVDVGVEAIYIPQSLLEDTPLRSLVALSPTSWYTDTAGIRFFFLAALLSPLPSHWSCLICSYIFHSYCAPPAVCGLLWWLAWAYHAPEPASGTWHATRLGFGCGYRGLRLVKLVRAFSSPLLGEGDENPLT